MFALSLFLSLSLDLEIPLKKKQTKPKSHLWQQIPTYESFAAEHFAKHFADTIRNNNQPEQR